MKESPVRAKAAHVRGDDGPGLVGTVFAVARHTAAGDERWLVLRLACTVPIFAKDRPRLVDPAAVVE